MTLVHNIASYIRRHDLLRADGLYLLGLSGGPDSVALLRALLALGYRTEAMHCNFHLRGEESERDEQFCVALCEHLHVPLHRIHFDTESHAALHHVSIEMAARELRYRYFEQLRRDIDADGIVIAHHQDDQVETVLLNLVRGTGIRGLQGIRPRNGHILRPMLGCTRQQILDYLDEIGQKYVVDSTNLEDDTKRNVLRHEVIPILRQLNPAFDNKVAELAERVGEVTSVMEADMQADIDRAVVPAVIPPSGMDLYGEGRVMTYSRDTLLGAKMAQPTFWHLFGAKGFKPAQVDEMMRETQSGRIWKSASTVVLSHQGKLLVVSRAEWERAWPTRRLPMEGTYVYEENTQESPVSSIKIRISREPYHFKDQISRDPYLATLDADSVAFPLTIRPVGEGDRFVPFGMKGQRLVSDFLTDRHLSLYRKRRQLVVCDARGHIVWVVGLRTAAPVSIGDKTKDMLRLQIFVL